MLLSIRIVYFKNEKSGDYFNQEVLKKFRIVLGFLDIISGFGIMFNFLLYLLLWNLPEGFIYIILESFFLYYNYEIEYLDIVFDIFQNNIFSILSFLALMNLFLCLFYYSKNSMNKNPRKTTYWLLSSIATGLLVGFSTCIPHLL
ncbi:MAG: hypothetical protein ACFFBP_18275 [Promethearchaeota archaeon]